MKTALIHYWLTNMRGGENVLLEFCRLFPEADIFTHACIPERVDERFARHHIQESFIAALPGGRRRCQRYLPLMFKALQKFDFADYDLLISSESGPAKNISKRPGAVHVCYCHSPMRYLYDMYEEYYRNASLSGKAAMKIFTSMLRKLDRASADKVDHFIANSHFVSERINRIYQRKSTVIHPPVDVTYFARQQRLEAQDYYLFAGQLTAYKNPELALKACIQMNRKLIVAGSGELQSQLQRRYQKYPNITFTGRCPQEQLRTLYAGAKALIFPNIEDFGIIPLEAQSCGTPVIALHGGGALETVSEHISGIFFPVPQVASLCGAIEEFESRRFNESAIRKHAETFDKAVFRQKIRQFLQDKINFSTL